MYLKIVKQVLTIYHPLSAYGEARADIIAVSLNVRDNCLETRAIVIVTAPECVASTALALHLYP